MPGLSVSRDPTPTGVPPGDGEPSAPLTGLVRVGRAAVLGGLSLLLATGAHLLGGGTLPQPGVLLVAATLLGLLAALLTARRCRFGPLALLLTGQQLALHELFSLAGAASACTVQATGEAHAAGAAHVVSSCVSGGMPMAGGAPGWAMWAAHLAAVVATAWLLARGEAWLWRAVERVVAAAGLARTSRALPLRPPRRLVATSAASWSSLVWSSGAPRGPPLIVA